jgi:hypothetical protein
MTDGPHPAVLVEIGKPRRWETIDIEEAVTLNLGERTDITAPHNEEGERCPWPWDPQQLTGAPMGQYHCPYCGAMVMAGIPHIDYGPAQC